MIYSLNMQTIRVGKYQFKKWWKILSLELQILFMFICIEHYLVCLALYVLISLYWYVFTNNICLLVMEMYFSFILILCYISYNIHILVYRVYTLRKNMICFYIFSMHEENSTVGCTIFYENRKQCLTVKRVTDTKKIIRFFGLIYSMVYPVR